MLFKIKETVAQSFVPVHISHRFNRNCEKTEPGSRLSFFVVVVNRIW